MNDVECKQLYETQEPSRAMSFFRKNVKGKK